MIKPLPAMLLAAVLSTVAFPASAQSPQGKPVPEGVAQEGTFASEQLQSDVMPSAFAFLKNDGCQELIAIFPYVRDMPVGQMGARHWSETWVFQCTNGTDEIDITFQETSDGGANYSLSSLTRSTLVTE
ncbi:hypothetical protein OK348_12875 [Flavobacterium sp. MXW15]|uniref:Uncharacterized protein n=1 Tax=Xanthomonas chitinilytica TaxID=2989819 RepID=A0ABT3JXE1_9XANT|nr:hypothetical protein [Xanthomonas sp. H13-6]MCW4455679.1 hypothetical protein [Flavobacterium sp. MXW15]MCW4472835.1 hypothetical protein [Xanthomonas sp. H13-6]